jgi:membrane protein
MDVDPVATHTPGVRLLKPLSLPDEVSGRRWRRAPVEIVQSFRDHECFFLAAGVSFYFMLSLIPMLFLLLAVIGYFLQGTTHVRQDLLEAVHAYIPFLSNEVVQNIETVVRNPGLLGWIGGGMLFLSTDLVFVALQSSLDKIFVPGRRSFLKSKMFSVLLGVMVFCVILGTIAVNAVDRSLDTFERLAEPAVPVGLHLSTPVIGALLLACFTLAIRMLPHVAIPLRYAFFGGLLGTGMWLVVKAYYVWYLSTISKVGPLFGSLSAVILTLMWVYVSSLVFLLGAEFTRWLILTDPERRAGAAAREDASSTAS